MALYMTEEEFQKLKQRWAGKTAACSRPTAPMSEAGQPKKRSKYGNQRVEAAGYKFDSRHEADVYILLQLRQQAGEIVCINRQVGFDLPGGIQYKADFVVWYPDHRCEVLDAKSEATKQNRTYINKKKQMKAIYGIEIVEV